MGVKSSIKSLAPDVLEQLQALLRDPRVTQLAATAQINAILAGAGDAPVSKSAVNRYAVQMDQIGAKLTQSRAIADMWIGKIGNEPQGKVGALLNEVVRNLAFEAAISLSEDETPADPKLIKALAEAVEKLERGANLNEKRVQDMRKQAVAEATEKAADIAKRSGLSSDAIAAFKREMLGVADAA